MPKEARKSRPISCRFCRTRKLRCSRDAPCSNCISRGIRCELEDTVLPPKSLRSREEELERRIQRLEQSLAARNEEHEIAPSQVGNGIEDGEDNANDPLVNGVVPEALPQVQNLDHDVAWLESIYMPQNTTGRISSDKMVFKICPARDILGAQRYISQNINTSAKHLEQSRCIWLPEYNEAQIMLDVYLREANQLPYVTHIPSLPKVLEDVYSDVSLQRQISPGQLLLVIAFFVGSTQSWLDGDCQRGLFTTVEEANLQGSVWIKTLEEVLDLTHRTTTISIEGVQGIIISAFVLANMEGLSRRCRSFYSMSLLLARELNLHRIDHPSNAANANTLQAEIGRRLWWYICASDWSIAARMTGPADGTYWCHMRQMCTRKPLNLNDDEVFDGMSGIEKPISQPTTMSYSLQRIRLSEISRNAVDRAPLSMALSREPNDHNVVDIDTELQALINELPPFFFMSLSQLIETYNLSQKAATDIVHQSHTIRFLVYTQRCTIHLPYFTKGFVDPAYSWSKDVCVKMARLIVSSPINLDKTSMCSSFRLKLSGLLLGVFMASIVLLMDLCVNKSSPQQEQKRKECAEAFRVLDEAKHESETTARFVESLTCILRKHKISPLQQSQSQGRSPQISKPTIEPSNVVETTGDLSNTNNFQPGHGNTYHHGDIPMNHENNDSNTNPDYTSYFGELAHTFEQGDEVGDFDWGNIFSTFESTMF